MPDVMSKRADAASAASTALESYELFLAGGGGALMVFAWNAGVISSLLERWATATEHAEHLGLDPGGLELAFDTLVAMGVADRDGERIGASAALRRISTGFFETVGDIWSHLPAFLRTGTRGITGMDGEPKDREKAYSPCVNWLGDIYADTATTFAEALPARTRILDIGAGSGIWSMAMAARTPDAHVTAVDFPDVLNAFMHRAERAGLSERVRTQPGNLYDLEVPVGRFDRVLIANVLHLEPPDQAASIIARWAPAVADGGDLVIVGVLGSGTKQRDVERALYSLHLGLRTQHGRNHPAAEIEAWCRSAGLEKLDEVFTSRAPWAAAALRFGRV